MRRLSKVSLSLLVVGTVVLGMSAGFVGAASAGPPVGGCPSDGDWFLAFVGQVEPGIDVGNAADQNGDGLICARLNSGLSPMHPNGGVTATITDNVIE